MTAQKLLTSGEVAALLRLTRWRLLYLVERGVVPPPSYQVPGRRLYTEADVRSIAAVLDQSPELRGDQADASPPPDS